MLLILLAVLPPVLWGAWWGWREWQSRRVVKHLELGRDEAAKTPATLNRP
jgi:hypothetical protein